MSETIEESGSNVLMLAAVLGTGRARWRFESDPDDTVGPDGMVQLKSDGERRTVQGPLFGIHSLLFIYASAHVIMQSGRECILPEVCG